MSDGPALDTLVIGIGNTLAGDDGVGARALQELRLPPGVRAMVVHQLTPELTEEVAGVRRVVFVDAGLTGSDVQVARLTPSGAWPALVHALSAPQLLGLTEAVYGRCPEALLITVPGCEFGPGTSLSPQTARRLSKAVETIQSLLRF